MATAQLLVELPEGMPLDRLVEFLAMHDVRVWACVVQPEDGPEARAARPYVQLTESEMAVLKAFTCWNSNEEIAAALHVSVEAIRWRVKTLYRKLRVNSRAFAVGRALRLGILTLEDLSPPHSG